MCPAYPVRKKLDKYNQSSTTSLATSISFLFLVKTIALVYNVSYLLFFFFQFCFVEGSGSILKSCECSGIMASLY